MIFHWPPKIDRKTRRPIVYLGTDIVTETKKNHNSFLVLGNVGIRLRFSNPQMAEHAKQHVFLSETYNGECAGMIDYIEDDSVSKLIKVPCNPNVVHIVKESISENHDRMILRMFDQYTFDIHIQTSHIFVHYPSHAPIRIMLDDVLYAALYPIIDRINGFILHGSCIVYKKIAIAFLGNSGAGKSTTAFNLLRFGFQCYADDAILVTRWRHGLRVWPLARELSIRPLAFRLLRSHQASIGDYCIDGEKYYFYQTNDRYPSAELKHVCFIETSGESETKLSHLKAGQGLNWLLRDSRHFSFMGRQSAEKYSKLLSENVPNFYHTQVGTDLDSQAIAIRKHILGQSGEERAPSMKRVNDIGREKKRALISKAWSTPTDVPLDKIIPLLGDFDLKIFALAMGFFQTYPLARLTSVYERMVIKRLPDRFGVDWLRGVEWLKGCLDLVNVTDLEVFRRFAFSWIQSAPLLYPFLKMATVSEPSKNEQVETAWERYQGFLQQRKVHQHKRHTFFTVLSRGRSRDLGSAIPNSDDIRHGIQSKKMERIYCVVRQDKELDEEAVRSLFSAWDDSCQMIVVPVVEHSEPFRLPVDVIRLAMSYGIEPTICRITPLCSLNEKDAGFLLDRGAIEETPRMKVIPLDYDKQLITWLSNQHIFWTNKPYPACDSCGCEWLGLCVGGFISKNRMDENL